MSALTIKNELKTKRCLRELRLEHCNCNSGKKILATCYRALLQFFCKQTRGIKVTLQNLRIKWAVVYHGMY